MAKNNGQSYPKGASKPYTYIARNSPTDRPRPQIEPWWPVGGTPKNQRTSQDGPGEVKNTGKIIDK